MPTQAFELKGIGAAVVTSYTRRSMGVSAGSRSGFIALREAEAPPTFRPPISAEIKKHVSASCVLDILGRDLLDCLIVVEIPDPLP